jgi:hypothetical protein
MELFRSIAKGSAGPLTEDEIKALEAADKEDRVLPEGADAELLAETAKSILGIGSGEAPDKVRQERKEEGEQEEAGASEE